jgi:murein DD-endopeptidase MepM/ murein hydrolase activator NlpD
LYQPQLQGNSATAGVSGGGTVPSLRGEAVPARRPLGWPGIPVARARIAKWRQAAASLAVGTDLATDLGAGIGTPGWWAGLVACLGLCTTAITLGTMVPALPETGRAPLTPSQRETLAPQFIAPLALGARTGARALPDPARVVPLAEIPERPRIELSTRMVRGRSFNTSLRRAGLSAEDARAAEALVRQAVNPATLANGTPLDIVLGRRETRNVPRPLESLGFRAAFDLRLVISRAAPEAPLSLRRIPIKVDSTPLRVTGLVGRSLDRSLRGAGIPAAQAREFTRTMGYVIDMQRGVGKSDRFDIIIEQDKAETGEVRHGAVLYGVIDRAGKDRVEVARYAPRGSGPDYFRENGESARKGLMRTPVDGARLTSGFGMRFHPLLAYSRMHQGVDFGARHGSPIYAAASGTAEFVGRHGGHGNYVRLSHANGLKTAYAHMSGFAIKGGQKVSQGQVIGYVGSTGVSTGPHLHYEVWLKGKPVNPMTLKFIGGTKLAGAEFNRFQSELSRLRNIAITGPDTPLPVERQTRRPVKG